jgi:hypothetical protein
MTVCRPGAGGCDLAETCTGTSAACPADAAVLRLGDEPMALRLWFHYAQDGRVEGRRLGQYLRNHGVPEVRVATGKERLRAGLLILGEVPFVPAGVPDWQAAARDIWHRSIVQHWDRVSAT